MEVIETMNNGGLSASMMTVVFDDCYFLACGFFITSLSIVIEK